MMKTNPFGLRCVDRRPFVYEWWNEHSYCFQLCWGWALTQWHMFRGINSNMYILARTCACATYTSSHPRHPRGDERWLHLVWVSTPTTSLFLLPVVGATGLQQMHSSKLSRSTPTTFDFWKERKYYNGNVYAYERPIWTLCNLIMENACTATLGNSPAAAPSTNTTDVVK